MSALDRATRLLADLVSIDSVNPLADPAGAGEGGVADYLEAWARRLGLDVERDEVFPGRPNLYAHLRATGAAPSLLFTAHMDTVPAGDMPDPFTPKIQGGRLTARGAADTKGPMASMLLALEDLAGRRRELPCHVTFAAVVDEEHSSGGIIHLVESGRRFDGAVVGEGTQLQPVVAHRGGAFMHVRVRGRSAHSSEPERGVNAIVHAAELIRHLDRELAPTLDRIRHPLIGPATMTVTLIRGGIALNIIPPECLLTVSRRSLPGETDHTMRAELQAAIDELHRQRPDITVDPVVVDSWEPAVEAPIDGPLARAALEATRAVLGQGEFVGAPWGSDASVLHNRGGIPAIVQGPGHAIAEAHSNHESIALDEVASCAHLFTHLALHFHQ